MASFYSSVSSDGGMLPTAYLLNQKLAYSSSELSNNKDYEIQHSVSLSYPNHVEPETIGSRDEMMFIPPTSDPTRMHEMNVTPRYSDGNSVISDTHITDYHGLSLSLGSQVPSLVQLPLGLNQYTNSSFCSLLSSGMQPESQSNGLKNVQYLSFDLTGKSQDMENYRFGNNLKMSSKTTSFSPSLHQELTGAFCNSKYLKAAQDLLNEVVNIHKVLSESGKVQNFNSNDQDGSTGTDVKRDDLQDSNAKGTRDLLPSERQDLQNKMTKLFSMLDEVDRTFKQYYHQMQVVVSSFDMVAGSGAAQPYTVVALRTISRQFRCLRDAIKKQIQEAQKSLGDQDGNSPGQGVLSRLRFVDQQLRQRKALHQFGVMRQPWRPQRGLPENAVSVLRAWLFEHFLHPYPKDSEKSVLARQTGLSRSQVANWFINARVRLWKPMIEEMYKEEFEDSEKEPKSSPQNAHDEIAAFDERRDEFLRSLTRPDTEMDARDLSYEAGAFQDNEDTFEPWRKNKLLRW